MVRHKDSASKKAKPADDLDIFEEFEAGGGAEEVTHPGAGAHAREGEERAAVSPPRAEEAPLPSEVAGDPEPLPEDDLGALAPDVPVALVAVVGKARTTVGDLVGLRMGQVINLGRAPGETVDLVANGRLVARGELVEMDGKMGVRILKLIR